MNDLWLYDHQFVTDRQREQSLVVDQQLAWMDAQSNKMCCSGEGDKAVDAANAKGAKDQELKAESFRRHQQQQQQINPANK